MVDLYPGRRRAEKSSACFDPALVDEARLWLLVLLVDLLVLMLLQLAVLLVLLVLPVDKRLACPSFLGILPPIGGRKDGRAKGYQI